jgi:PKHD-type hydroxylase
MLLQSPDLSPPMKFARSARILESADWEDGRRHGRASRRQRQEAISNFPNQPTAKALGDRILDRLAKTPLYIAAALPQRVYPPRFNRYEGGGTYGNHVDNAIFPIPGTPLKLRTDLSTTIFFSDPDDYEGGELVIEDTFGDQRIKLPAGDMILYPSSSVHRVNPVTQGTRFASFFFTQSMIRDDAQRRILFELDCAIQALTADHPGHEALDNLSNVYHNMLRQWADT